MKRTKWERKRRMWREEKWNNGIINKSQILMRENLVREKDSWLEKKEESAEKDCDGKDKVLDVATNKKFSICPLAKQSRLMFPTSHTVSEKPLELIHMDTQFSTAIKVVRTDNGTEFFNKGECIEGAVYLINRLPTEVLQGKSPYELLHGRPPSLNHLQVFGCLCYATTIVTNDKFGARARAAVLLRYSTTQKDYKLLDLNSNKFFSPERGRSFDTQVAHQQNNQLAHGHQGVHSIDADAAADAVDDVHNIDADAAADAVHANSPAEVDTDPNQADINSVKHEHLDNAEVEELAEILNSVPASDNTRDEVPDVNSIDTNVRRKLVANISAIIKPQTFQEASKDERWIEAMKLEIKALEDNNTWEIVDLPKGKNAIG
ncbi:uncharacterized protein LOC142166132 [Nicotiana tabacum]|uniref:Uncharacterized protein LOC142166132 n=1 Tax=Nicotiana tabacum TaxID=4097 RepID=A0AC58S6T0_TOBAC